MAAVTETHAVPVLTEQQSFSSSNEKDAHILEGTTKPEDDESVFETIDDHDVTKPFPVDPDYVEEEYQLTFRAVFVGCCLGCVVGASNIYLGLKTGFTFGASLFGAIFGFAILKTVSTVIPESGILAKVVGGGPFGPKENCTVQTAATAAGGMGIIMVSAVPAMYRLGLMSEYPQSDIGDLIALTFASALFGLAFVVPLRRYYIVSLKLTFPTPAATAYTIRSLHSGTKGMIIAKKKSLALLWSFLSAFVFKIVAGYAPGILLDWHIGWTLSRIGFTSMIKLDNYGWWIEFTPAFFGAGMLSGMNASYSFFGGMVLAWGIIAPSLIATGQAVGVQPLAEDGFPEIWSYTGMTKSDPALFVTEASPRYWLLWPGVLMMVTFSFTDLAMNMIPIFKNLRKANSGFSIKGIFQRRTEIGVDDEDQTPLEDRIPVLWWATALVLTIVMSVAILAAKFKMNVGTAILSLILGFLFSFLAAQSSGTTDVNPVSTCAKASQLIVGGVAKGQGLEINKAMMTNLIAGTVAAGAAAQSCDMLGDLKTGYLLRAKPRNQWIAQLCGSVVACFLSVGLFILFVNASPCIIYPDLVPDGQLCPYGAPSVAAWAAVAQAVVADFLPIPPSSGYAAIGFGIFAAVMVVIKYTFVPTKYHVYMPNWNAVGLAFVVPNTYYATAMVVGATVNFYWEKRSPKTFDLLMFPISAGLVAGEGLAGVLQALFAIVGIDGGVYGTAIGCPANEFCG